MNNLMQSILIGISNFPFFAVILTLPIFATQLMKYKAINPVRIAVNYVAILYFLCLFALVFLPLPDMAKASQLSGYKIQLIPFRFLADIIKESPLVITNIHTYIPAIFHRAVLQVVFNVIMTIPFGMLLSYYFEFDAKKVFISSLGLTLFIEIGQLTGLFFIYSGSYRFCDIDDIMANTLGGVIGYVAVKACHFLPKIKSFDHQLVSLQRAKTTIALTR